MNAIVQTQNELGQIERLAAQRQLYSDAKLHQAVLIAATIISVIAAFVTPFWTDMQTWAAGIGIAVVIYEHLFAMPAQNALRERAAKTKELFDCDVLQLPWSDHTAGRKPIPEEVREAYNRYKKTEPDLKSLVDWYPTEVGALPLGLARIICQRSSCRWDGNIRRKFANVFLGVVLVIVTAAFSVSIWQKMEVPSLLLGVAMPLLPAINLGIKQYKEQQDAANSVNALREQLESIWEKALEGAISEAEATTASRELQTAIYYHCCKSPLVFDRVYKMLRDINEEQMNVGAREYIKQARKHLGHPPAPISS